MTLPSRVVSAVTLSALLVTALAGCGSDQARKAEAQAHTHACRAYVLVGGADADDLSEELQAALDDAGTYNKDDVVARANAIRAAATRAGLTEDLSTKDFRLFAALVDATLRAQTAVQEEEADLSGQSAAIATYTRSVKALDARCA